MRKVVAKIVLTLLVIAMAISIFVACETKETYSVSFVDIDDAGSVTDAMTAAQAQEYFGSLPTRQGYVFMGWYLDKDKWEQKIESTEDIEKYIVSGNVNVYAKWVPIENAITILFMDYNQASLFEYQCDRSEVDMSFLKPSTKPTDSKYTYTFDHWECDMSDLTQAFYIANPVYKEHLRVFEVKYYDQGMLIATDKVEYGKDADLFTLSNKAATAQYEYKFNGWEGAEKAKNVTSDVTLNALWKQTLRSYTVTFKDGSTILKEQKVTYGSSATAPTNTKKKDTAQYRYTFHGWDNTFDDIRSDTVVNAIYSTTLQSYEVFFYVDDRLYYNTNALYGDPVDAPADPIKELNDGYIYTFKEWDKSFESITGETRINAIFDRQSQTFDVTYYNWDGTILYTEEVETGKASVHKDEIAQRESNPQYNYQFIGWTNSDKLSDVRSNLSVYPKFSENKRTYKVTFNYGHGEQDEQDVYYGENATAPTDVQKSETAQYKYEFNYWDASYENIQKDTVVNAVYNEIIKIYEVTFLIEGTDEHIVTRYVKYGESAIAPDPEKFAKITDDGFTYTFKEWDKSFDDIQENTTVYALFNKISHTYEIRYVNWDGTLLYTDSVESGESSVYPNGTPEREPNTKYLYTFNGWKDKAENGKDATDALNCVTKSFAVYADYDEQIRTYTVTFDYGYDKAPVVMNVAYGTNLVGQEPMDTDRERDVQFSYEFLGWAGNLGYIYEDTTITARWAETLRKYLVKFIIDGRVISEQEVGYGFSPSRPNITEMSKTAKYEYNALGWVTDSGNYVDSQFVDFDDENYDENAFVGIDVENIIVNEDTLVGEQIVYTAIYLRTIREYFVTFFNEQILGERQQVLQIKVKYGSDATALAPIVERDMTVSTVYMFDCWSKDLTCILGDIEVDAKYTDDLRPYTVIYYIDISNDDSVVYEECYRETVKYSKGVQNKPETPESKWTVGFEYKFARWGAGDDNTKLSDDDYVRGDTAMYAKYDNLRRKYRVTFFDLSMYKLISTTELYYEEKISTTIENDGYDFDAWYRDPDCSEMFNMDTGYVDGIMMLFGNTVISGLEYSGSVVTGYHGELADVILPRYVQGTKMTEVKSKAFEGNEVMETIYIPNTYKKVNAFVFKDIKELDIYTEAVNGAGLDYPYGWSSYWNNNSVLIGSNDSRTVTNNVENVVTQGDYRYMLIGGGNTAIISKFVNNNAARAYIKETLNYQNPSFNYVENIDEKTGQKRNIYTIVWTDKEYGITTIGNSAFSGCENLGSIFIPKTITSVKKYAFSGITANLYIQRDRPKAGLVETDLPSGWNMYWNSNRKGAEGERTLYWGVIGMDEIDKFTYIFKNDKTAIVAEFNGGSLSLVGTITIPDTVEYRSPEDANVKTDYTVTELGDSLFEASLVSLGTVSAVKLPTGLTKIGKKVFYMNKTITKMELPSGVTEIGDYAFTGTTKLEEVFVPAAIEKFGKFCFAGSGATIYIARKKPVLPTDKPTRGVYWNAKVDMTDITDMDVSKIAGLIFGSQTLPTYWEVAGRTTDTASSTGITVNFTYILRSDGTAYLAGYKNTGAVSLKEYVIPETIEYNGTTYTINEIGEGALSGDKYIASIYIPKTVTTIGASAFSGCSNLTINTAWEEQPSGWDDSFNPDNRTVNWGVIK